MIGADRCVKGAFGDWDMRWGVGNGLTYQSWRWIGRLVTDWQIGDGLADWWWIGDGLADWHGISRGLA